MSAGSISRWALPVAGLLSSALALSAAGTWVIRHDPGSASMQEAAVGLRTVLRREQAWFTNNHCYSPLVEDLHLTSSLPAGWRYQVVATTLDQHPLLLVEADDGHRRLCVDGNGTLFRSTTGNRLELTPWIPVTPEVGHANGR